MNFELIPVSADASPYSITGDDKGTIYFTANKGNFIGAIVNGKIREHPIPTLNAGASIITMNGEDAWFTMYNADKLGRLTPKGAIEEIALPSGCNPFGISADTKGRIWFTCVGTHQVGCYADGRLGLYDLPTPACYPSFISCAADGKVWFCENQGNKVGYITADGAITEFDLPNPTSAPVGIVAHHGGAAFVEIMGNRVGFIDYNGTIREYSFSTPDAKPHAIAAAPDGSFWVSLWGVGKLAHITQSGKITEYDIPTSNAEPHGIYADSCGSVWTALENAGIGIFRCYCDNS